MWNKQNDEKKTAINTGDTKFLEYIGEEKDKDSC